MLGFCTRPFAVRVREPACIHRASLLDKPPARFYAPSMKKNRAMTVTEAGRLGGQAVVKKYGRKQLRAWGKLGGRPPKRRKKPKK